MIQNQNSSSMRQSPSGSQSPSLMVANPSPSQAQQQPQGRQHPPINSMHNPIQTINYQHAQPKPPQQVNGNRSNVDASNPHLAPVPTPNSNPSPGHIRKHKHSKPLLNLPFLGAILAIPLLSLLFLYQFFFVTHHHLFLPTLVVFLILFLLTQWSYWSTVCNHPGKVPMYYGMSPQLNQQMLRKYCILCHNFKPKRTHHCSTCYTCVLNMDHHCPWVNNCIGFENRKYFILFLVYISLGLVWMSLVEILVIVEQIKRVVQTKQTDIHFALKLIIILVTLPLAFMLIAFTVFHMKMVLNNTTTLEGLIRKKGGPQSDTIEDYDIGRCENFKQVFGEKCLYWWAPVWGQGPKGNGTYFAKAEDKHDHYRTRQEYEVVPLASTKEIDRAKSRIAANTNNNYAYGYTTRDLY